MQTFQPNLLRRTAVAFVAAAGLAAFGLPSQAAVITLSGITGSPSCSYSSMSVQPDGSFNVICQGTPVTNTTDAGSFSFVAATGTVDVGGARAFYPVSRASGATGAVSMNYTVSGGGCSNGVGSLSWADGDTSSQSAIVQGLVNGSCTVTLGSPTLVSGSPTTAPRLGSQSSMAITVGTAPIQQPVTGLDTSQCPTNYTVPADILQQTFLGVGNWFPVTAKSNQITTLKLPATQPGYASGMVSLGESPVVSTPQPVTLTISINKCPGLIDTDQTNHCNVVSQGGAQNNITWFQSPSPYAGVTDQTTANARGYCWAPGGSGYYVNMKWSYNQCGNFASTCGFTVLQNYGSY